MRYMITSVLLVSVAALLAQSPAPVASEVKNSTIEFNGGKYNGYIIEYNASPGIVEEVVKEKFKLEGVKPKEMRDFMVYRSIRIPSIDLVNPLDAFIKVERKSRKEKEQSVVYFIVTPQGAIPDEKVKADAAAQVNGIAEVTSGSSFLGVLTSDVAKAVYDQDLLNQMATLKKEEKKLSDLVEDQLNLEKKLKKLQSDLEYNKKAQERQAAEIEKSKLKLSELKTKEPVL